MRMLLLIVGALLASDAVAGPVLLRTRIECLTEQVQCKAVEAAMAVGVKAERLGSAAADAYDFELVAEVQPVAVFFELRDRKGIRFIAHTDVAEYRAPHAAADTLVWVGFLTVAFAPIAYDLDPPTTLADRSRAWTVMTRRVIRQGILGGKSYVGAREGRSKHWRVDFGTPEVRRKRVIADDEVLAQDSDFEPPRARAISQPGVTRVLVPVTLRRR